MRQAVASDEGIGQGVSYLSPAKMPLVYTKRTILNVAMPICL